MWSYYGLKAFYFKYKVMKKIALFIVALGLMAIALVSCKASGDCPAYGEVHKYQVEQRY